MSSVFTSDMDLAKPHLQRNIYIKTYQTAKTYGVTCTPIVKSC